MVDWYSKGSIYFSDRNYHKAIECWIKSIEIDKNNFRAFVYLGMAYNKLDQYKAAIESYQKAIELNENYDKAFNNLANIYRKAGKFYK